MTSAAEDDNDGTGRFCIVMTTIDSASSAESLAATLVEARLAACVQIVPVQSVYRWREQLQRDGEWLLIVKTADARYDEVERAIRAAHRYETPEITKFSIDGGSADYLAWLGDSVAPPPRT